jgi:glutamyl/glutaminyl-tRNA synthetase
VECPIFDEKNDIHAQRIVDDSKNSHTKRITNTIDGLQNLIDLIESLDNFDCSFIEEAIRQFCKNQEIKLNDAIMPARIAITGSTISPSLFEVMSILGKDEIISRLTVYRDFMNSLKKHEL